MRLARVIIKNFKGIKSLDFLMPTSSKERPGSGDFLTIIGENNRCKSTVLEAIRLAFPKTDIIKPKKEHFPDRNFDNGPIEITLHFDNITHNDKNKRGVRTHVWNDEYKIKKTWSYNSTDETVEAHPILVFCPDYKISESEKSLLQSGGFPALQSKDERWKTVIVKYIAALEKEERTKAKAKVKSASSLISKPKLTQAETTAFEKFVVVNHCELCEQGAVDWRESPGGNRSNPDSALPTIIFVPAVPLTEKEADPQSKGGAANKILGQLFDTYLRNDPRVENFKNAISELRNLFNKKSGLEALVKLQDDLSASMKRIMPLDIELDYEPPEVSATLSESASMIVHDGDFHTRPWLQGHGAQRALILVLLEMLAKQLSLKGEEAPASDDAQETDDPQSSAETKKEAILLVEEPEIYLHPQMTRKMRDVLLEIARSKDAQVICTTHSPVFIDLADRHDGLLILRRIDERRDILGCQNTIDLFATDAEARARMRMVLNFDSSANEVFFGECAVLVEGDSEIAAFSTAIEQIAKERNKSVSQVWNDVRNIKLVNCQGKTTIPAFQQVLNAFEIPYRVIHDRDKNSTSTNEKIAKLQPATNRILVLDQNLDLAILGEPVKDDKPWKITSYIRKTPISAWPSGLLNYLLFIVGGKFFCKYEIPIPPSLAVHEALPLASIGA